MNSKPIYWRTYYERRLYGKRDMRNSPLPRVFKVGLVLGVMLLAGCGYQVDAASIRAAQHFCQEREGLMSMSSMLVRCGDTSTATRNDVAAAYAKHVQTTKKEQDNVD